MIAILDCNFLSGITLTILRFITTLPLRHTRTLLFVVLSKIRGLMIYQDV